MIYESFLQSLWICGKDFFVFIRFSSVSAKADAGKKLGFPII